MSGSCSVPQVRNVWRVCGEQDDLWPQVVLCQISKVPEVAQVLRCPWHKSILVLDLGPQHVRPGQPVDRWTHASKLSWIAANPFQPTAGLSNKPPQTLEVRC